MSGTKLHAMYHSVGLNNHITDGAAKEIIESPYLFTKETINSLDLDNISEEAFEKLDTNFIYKYIGKLHTNYKSINKIKINRETFKNTHKTWKKEQKK